MLTLLLIGLLAGAVTAVSPCVLPVLPVVFFGAGGVAAGGVAAGGVAPGGVAAGGVAAGGVAAGGVAPSGVIPGQDGVGTAVPVAARPRSAPLLIVTGLVGSFAVLTLAGSTVVTALHLPADVVRWAGLLVLFTAGLGLLVPSVQRQLQRPFSRFPRYTPAGTTRPFVLGLALGALYVPCAGPVIAAIAIAGATGDVDGGVVVLTAGFSIGTAIPLLLIAYWGERIGIRTARARSGIRRFRIAGGVVMMALAVAITLGAGPVLSGWVPSYTTAAQGLIEDNLTARDALRQLGAPDANSAPTPPPRAGSAATQDSMAAAAPASGPVVTCQSAAEALQNCGSAPALMGIDTWINTPGGAAVDLTGLRGKVVLVDFWTFACVNCQHVLPWVTAWSDRYRDAGLEVIGVHTPEFTFERDADNVRDAVAEEGIHYPVGLDNAAATWRGYGNSYWPAAYLIDADGTLRYIKFGEGDYRHTESLVRQLLSAANPGVALPDPVDEPGS